MAQGWSTEIISMIKWIRASGLSTKNPLSAGACSGAGEQGGVYGARRSLLGAGRQGMILEALN